ncbi:glycosyltransferase family 2 protein, partial [Intrasporangium flavum]|uniref:glycosyltransferase family 2 protein n=1 Tax=Intrasporangium flavum TaxID=1428657 RepID=UPI001A978F4D
MGAATETDQQHQQERERRQERQQPTDAAGPSFSIVSAVYDVARYLPEFFASLEQQDYDLSLLQVVAVDDGSTDDSLAVLRAWAQRAPFEVVVLTQENAGQAAARNAGLEHATGDWVTFTDPDDTVNAGYLSSVAAFVARHPEVCFVSTNMVLRMEATGALAKHPRAKMFTQGDALVDLDVATSFIPNSATTSVMRRDLVGDLRFNHRLRPNFEDGDFAARYLMAAPTRRTGFLASAEYYYRKRADQSSTLQTGISATGRYGVVPREGYLALLTDARRQWGAVPLWLQNTVLYDLSWYFSSEDAMASSASAIDGDLGASFRRTLREIADELTPDVVDSFTIRKLQPHWRDILLHGLGTGDWHTPYAVTDRYDRATHVVRLRYRYIGEPPTEQFRSRGVPLAPLHAKTRRMDFFGATVMWERILWVPATGTVELLVDGVRLDLAEDWETNHVRALGAKALAARFRKAEQGGRPSKREAARRLTVDPVRV